MSKIHYYMTLFPTETLIASMLSPESFGAYMAMGAKHGSHERLIFAEIEGEFGDDFDWVDARARTVPHKNGAPKNSVYLSAYRVLERVPVDNIGKLYLTAVDGRTIGLESSPFPEDVAGSPYYLYQDLCPLHPVVVSTMGPLAFGEYMVSDSCKIKLPVLCYCDLKVVDIKDPVNTGNIGPMYDRNLSHLNECIKAVTERGKLTKTLERTFADSFSYQIVRSGFAIVRPDGKRWYAMPSPDEMFKNHYDWARSAMIL
jgi:hypothetical protein